MNAPVITKTTDLPIFKMEQSRALQVLKSSLFPGAADQSVLMVLGWCEARGVDPMDKPCHIVPMWDSKTDAYRDVIMPSVDYYRQKAESTGEYVGLSDTEYGPDKTEKLGEVEITYPTWARVVVRRIVQGHIAEFPAKVFWKEAYATQKKSVLDPNAMWRKRPYGQLEKCAEALALRRAFPILCGGPTAEELAGKTIDDATTIEGEIVTKTVTVEQPRSTRQTEPPAHQQPASSAHADSPGQSPPSAGAAPTRHANGDAAQRPISEGAKNTLLRRLKATARTEIDACAKFGVAKIDDMTFDQFQAAMKWLNEVPAAA